MRDVVRLILKTKDEQMDTLSIDQLRNSVGFTQRHADWKLILESCISIQEKASRSSIILDEQIFASRRYGFDPKQA